jgi:protoporphyrin/coproporphyrin ferrochelatase
LEKTQTGILLVNLGTPDSPATSDVRSYLKEFLLDPRVIDIPAIPRNLLVRGIIAPFRAPKSAKSYKEIWTDEGSPLLFYSQRAADLLQQKLGDQYVVRLAMRYGKPSIPSILAEMQKMSLKKIRVIPLFPQYASATTGSVHQRVMEIVSDWQTIPDIEFVNSYPDHPELIAAFAANGRALNPEQYDHILFSFHGLPQRQLRKADMGNHCLSSTSCCETYGTHNQYCYGAQCQLTARKIAESLGLEKSAYTVCYQSRLGKDPWIQPYTSVVLEELAKAGKRRILVFSPAFVADCLETIFEIGTEYQEEFEEMGGEKVTLVPSLNDQEAWISTLKDLSLRAMI